MKRIFVGLAAVSVMTACSNTDREAEIQQAKQYTIDSINAVAAQKEAEAKLVEQKRLAAKKRTTTTYHSYSSSGSLPTATTTKQDRPGWSNKAKGAVIGGVVGAVTGAAVSNKKGKGAIIGGVAGAAGGYGIGAILDNKKKKGQ
jgi:hypothetical protein